MKIKYLAFVDDEGDVPELYVPDLGLWVIGGLGLSSDDATRSVAEYVKEYIAYTGTYPTPSNMQRLSKTFPNVANVKVSSITVEV